MKLVGVFLIFILMLSFSFVSAHELEIEHFHDEENQFEDFVDGEEELFVDDQDYSDEELFPEEMSLEESETPVKEPWIEKDTDGKGIYYEIHYDEYERAVRVEDHFIRGYKGVSEYEFFPKLQRRQRDGHYGYEWVISQEIGTFYKNDEVIATRIIEFDKQGNKIGEEKTGSTIIITVMRLLSNFYNVPPPEDI